MRQTKQVTLNVLLHNTKINYSSMIQVGGINFFNSLIHFHKSRKKHALHQILFEVFKTAQFLFNTWLHKEMSIRSYPFLLVGLSMKSSSSLLSVLIVFLILHRHSLILAAALWNSEVCSRLVVAETWHGSLCEFGFASSAFFSLVPSFLSQVIPDRVPLTCKYMPQSTYFNILVDSIY